MVVEAPSPTAEGHGRSKLAGGQPYSCAFPEAREIFFCPNVGWSSAPEIESCVGCNRPTLQNIQRCRRSDAVKGCSEEEWLRGRFMEM